MKILIVDDDLVDREHIKRTLVRYEPSCVFIEASSVDEGLEILKEQCFDVILLDYRMPQRDGIELLIEVRDQSVGSSVAIIMLSNSEDMELALECMRAGAQDFLLKSEVKPLRLHRAIAHSKARFELETKLYESYKQAKKLAEHDALTGLANRYAFEEGLRFISEHGSRDNNKLALVLFDLDHFKYVNDNHGHDVGDLLLKELAQRVKSQLRGDELFARLGGDEFAIILSNIKDLNDVTTVVQRIIDVMRAPFNINEIEIKVGVSAGISIYPDNSTKVVDLLKYADIAMYRSKKLGRNQLCYFEDALQRQFLQRYEVENELRESLKESNFVLHYQPVFETNSKTLTGFEALIRRKVDGSLQMPGDFISIAEKSSVINAIGRWVIENAIYQISIWNKKSSHPLTMSINISPVQLKDRELVAYIEDCLSRYDVSPHCIEFELTETTLLSNCDRTINALNSIGSINCRIALDDFGTGYSSVSHLQNYSIDTVKIDKSLMLNSDDPKTRSLIKGLVLMLHSIEINVVAEGVELESAFQLCQDIGVQKLQGFLFSTPKSASVIECEYFAA